MKRQKGITLIALVITIIVLLILAGVSISLVVGQNGVLSNAQNAVIADAKAKEEEAVKRSALAAMSISSSKGNIALENAYFNQELKNEFGEGNYLLEEQTDKFTVTIVGTGNSYEIDKVGNVSGQVPPEENGGEGEENAGGTGWEGIYPDADTQPTDPSRFLYSVISEEDKTIKITGIKTDYKSDYYLFGWEYDGVSLPEGKQTELIVPYEIDGYAVKEIYDLSELNTVLNMELPKGVEVISGGGGKGTFEKCYNLISISIPDTLTEIGDDAFDLCSKLSNITIPNSVTTIGERAFFGCNSITSITIPDGVTKIEYRTFQGCNNLTSVTIPTSVTMIDSYAFELCNSLQTINYRGTQEMWNAITIDSTGNSDLTNATLVPNYTGE